MDNKIRILTADAGEEFRSLLNDALSEEPDMEVIASTGDGQEAIRLAKELVPDVVAMDLVLTRMDGLEVLCELASLTPRPRVLVISSFASGAVAAHAASAGADYYLMKPCRMTTAAERIRQLSALIQPDQEEAAQTAAKAPEAPNLTLEPSLTAEDAAAAQAASSTTVAQVWNSGRRPWRAGLP